MHLPIAVQVLEIGSGTGQHAVHFAAHLAHLTWHPTEQLAYLADLAPRVKLEGARNLRPPTVLDVKQPVWPLRTSMPFSPPIRCTSCPGPRYWPCSRVSAPSWPPGGVICVYGPFRYAGRYTSDSNRDFDRMLQERDPLSGLRDIEALTALAVQYGLRLKVDHDLPANNRLLEFVRD